MKHSPILLFLCALLFSGCGKGPADVPDPTCIEDLIAKLNEDRAIMERERLEIESAKREIERLRKQHKSQDENLDARKEKILREAREEAQRILSEAKDTADDTIKQINKIKYDSGINKALEKQRSRIREGLKKTETIMPEDAGEDALTRLKKAWISGNGNTPQEPERHTSHIKSNTISYEINVIGKNVDEACSELDKYLDDALLAHLNYVRIIHGRGTGALKKGIHSYLKRLKFVKSCHAAEFDDGGEAVTVVEFK